MIAHRLPFFYGWVILVCCCCAGFARQGPAVATLSMFIVPMTDEFGWSRTAISFAVSLGGILAAIVSPMLGVLTDRAGARAILNWAVITTGLLLLALSQIETLIAFTVLFCLARMNFAGPFDLGIYGALTNWFVKRRATATSIVTLGQMLGLVAMPLIAQFAINEGGWRLGWIAVGATVLVIGFLPNFFLMVRRPEDIAMVPDWKVRPASPNPSETGSHKPNGHQQAVQITDEPAFTRAEALRTPAFWLLSVFTLLVFPVQAGFSLHQAPHLIERGISPTDAAFIVSIFAVLSAISGLAFGWIARRLPISVCLALSAAFLGASSAFMVVIDSVAMGYVAAALFGTGIGGLLTVLPIAWADYFGRRSFGAIRGVALSIQVVAQASGPVISGVLRDYSGDYVLSLEVFAGLSALAVLVGLLTRAPKPPSTGSAKRP